MRRYIRIDKKKMKNHQQLVGGMLMKLGQMKILYRDDKIREPLGLSFRVNEASRLGNLMKSEPTSTR